MGGREPWSRSRRRHREPARGFARRPRCAVGDGGRLTAQGDRRQTERTAAAAAATSTVPAERNCAAAALVLLALRQNPIGGRSSKDEVRARPSSNASKTRGAEQHVVHN